MKKMFTSKKYGAVALVCLLAIGGLVWFYFFSAFANSDKKQFVFIDDDDTPDSVLAKLQPLGTSHGMTGFSTLMRHTSYRDRVRPGCYAVEPRLSTMTLFRRMKNGVQSPMNLTIPSVRTLDKLAAAVSRKLKLDSATVCRTLTDQQACQALGFDTVTIAAMFIPNTYDIFWDVSMEKFLKRMKKEYDRYWNDDRRAKARACGLTPVQVSTLASIINEETANDDEKPKIAGMYLNRLKTNMPLQADPTVKFALGDFTLKRIYNHMLNVDSPYNTYRHEGLPPGPIRIPTVAALEAVLNHEKNDYLYMCAKEDFSGTHNFAKTYQEHLDNAARYSKALNERGIK